MAVVGTVKFLDLGVLNSPELFEIGILRLKAAKLA